MRSALIILRCKIIFYQGLQQGITVNTADKITRVIVGGDVGRILGQNVTHYLIYGVIALFFKRVINLGQNSANFLLGLVTD